MNNFIPVKKRNTINTQKNIHKFLCDYNLNEFIHRIDDGIFKMHLNQYLIKNKLWQKDFHISLNFDSKNNLDLYIFFREDGKEKAHFTMHLAGIDYSENKSGPYHLKLKNAIILKNKTKRNKYIPIKVQKKSGEIELSYNKMKKNKQININYIIDNNKEYGALLELINHYLHSSKSLSLTKNISGKKYIPHPYYLKVNHVIMCKKIFLSKGNLSKTLRKIKYRECKPFLKCSESRKSKRNITPSILKRVSKKHINTKTGIEYNELKRNKETKKDNKKSINKYLKIKNNIVVENVTKTI